MLNQLYTSHVSKFGQLRRGAADGDNARQKELADVALGPVITKFIENHGDELDHAGLDVELYPYAYEQLNTTQYAVGTRVNGKEVQVERRSDTAISENAHGDTFLKKLVKDAVTQSRPQSIGFSLDPFDGTH